MPTDSTTLRPQGGLRAQTATSQEDIKEVTFAYGRTADGGFKIYTSVRSEAEPLT
jgi:hypothetical protein